MSSPFLFAAITATGKEFAYCAGEIRCLFIVRVYMAGGGDVTGKVVFLVGNGVLFFAMASTCAHDHHTLAIFLVGVSKPRVKVKAQPFMYPVRSTGPFKSLVHFFLIAFLGMEKGFHFPVIFLYVNIPCVHVTDILPTLMEFLFLYILHNIP